MIYSTNACSPRTAKTFAKAIIRLMTVARMAQANLKEDGLSLEVWKQTISRLENNCRVPIWERIMMKNYNELELYNKEKNLHLPGGDIHSGTNIIIFI